MPRSMRVMRAAPSRARWCRGRGPAARPVRRIRPRRLRPPRLLAGGGEDLGRSARCRCRRRARPRASGRRRCGAGTRCRRRRRARRRSILDGGDLVGEHRGRDVGVLHREGAAEAAALVGVGQRRVLDAGDRADEVVLPAAEPEHPHAVAGGVVGDAVGEPRVELGGGVDDAELVDEQLRQLEVQAPSASARAAKRVVAAAARRPSAAGGGPRRPASPRRRRRGRRRAVRRRRRGCARSAARRAGRRCSRASGRSRPARG